MSALGTGVFPKPGYSVEENGALTKQLIEKALHSWNPNEENRASPMPTNISN